MSAVAVTTVLGFDYGELRVGVALGQSITGCGRPLTTLRNRERHSIDWAAIGTLIEQWRPQALVVGLPVDDDGVPYPVAEAIRRFGNRLHGRFGLPVYYADERLTSNEATRRMQAPAGKRRNEAPIDAMAAAVILDTWFCQQPR